jgi:hypothetical protein
VKKSQYGWVDWANISVPKDARVVEIQADVNNGGQHYGVYQKWVKGVEPALGPDYWSAEFQADRVERVD